jgi:AcrR family transcriptional regulator
MARPRSIADEDILEAANVIMQAGGPAGLTFAAVAKATGLAAATLVQRFGSRDAMLVAALLRAWDQLEAQTREADAVFAATPEGAVHLLASLSGQYSDDDYADGLLLLREDMRHPQLRVRGEAWGKMLAAMLGRRLSADAHRQALLGQLMLAQWQGIVLLWGFSRNGRVGEIVKRQLGQWCAEIGSIARA